MIKLKNLLAEQRIHYNVNTMEDAMLNQQFKLYDVNTDTQIMLTKDDDIDNDELTLKANVDALKSDLTHANLKYGQQLRLEFHYTDREVKKEQEKVEEFYNGMADGEVVFNVENSDVIKYIKQIKITNLGE